MTTQRLWHIDKLTKLRKTLIDRFEALKSEINALFHVAESAVLVHSLAASNNVKCLRRNNWQLGRNQSDLTISEGKSARRHDFMNGNFEIHTEALQNKLHLMCRELAKLAERENDMERA